MFMPPARLPRAADSPASPSANVLDHVLEEFSPATRAWFSASFPHPTPVQAATWQAIRAGGNVLVSAPTGSGKTLAAFLVAIDQLIAPPSPASAPESAPDSSLAQAPDAGVKVLYLSPLKALAHDIDRNLTAPLVGIGHAAQRLGQALAPVRVGMRTGDTSPQERRNQAKHPPDIFITTPESLYLLLTSAARSGLANVQTVIIDEVHAVAGTKRGAHLALSLERLEALRRQANPDVAPMRRIGLSATQRPLEEIARWLGGGTPSSAPAAESDDQEVAQGQELPWTPRPVHIVAPPSDKRLEVQIVVPVEDMSRLGEPVKGAPVDPASGSAERHSIWPAIHPRILELVRAHRSTIVFANSRRLAERLTARLNELAEAEADPDQPFEPIAKAHHGSVSREQRLQIEGDLKAGRLRCVVATSSLELGIDMGAVDLVIQVESPGAVSRGLQRIGRAGHQVGEPSRGVVFPKYRGDLLEATVVVGRMLRGQIEETRYPRNPLDVLAQQIVAMTAMDDVAVSDVHDIARSAAPFAELSREQLDGVLDLLSGRYPSDEFAELRPRVVWDRAEDRLSPRPGAQRLAITSGGTIPDRGLYGVFLAGDGAGRRVGELDEEMVYETRPGETVILGSSTWRIEDITRDQVIVSPAPGQPGKLPFWHGDAPGRPIEVGRALGAFLRELETKEQAEAATWLHDEHGLDTLAARNLAQYIAEQREATGTLPSDRSIVIERFRDEIGDWRLCVLSPFGARVHAPWALAIKAKAEQLLGVSVQTLHTDDGIVLRFLDADELPPLDLVLIDPDEIEDLVVGQLSNSPLFASRFRECAARALLLPRRRPGSRTPLWQQRQRAADLLSVAARYPAFPILLEAYREVLRDVFDLPALIGVLRDVASRTVRVTEVDTPSASPFASSLLFEYVAGYLYDGDAPLAERRAQALSLDRRLLAELLGDEGLRDLLDPEILVQIEQEVQRLAADRRAKDLDDVHDLLRTVGDLTTDEVAVRTDAEARSVRHWLAELEDARRAVRLRIAGEERWTAVEDAARFRDGLGVPLPPGLPDALLEPVERPLVDLVARYARTHAVFVVDDVVRRLALPRDAVGLALAELGREGRVVEGDFRGGQGGSDWCDAEVLRRVRRRALAALRREVEPVEHQALARFLPAWQGVMPAGPAARGGPDRLLDVIEQLQGAPIPASVLERDVLSVRLPGYQSAWLDELLASGEVAWLGAGPLGAKDGRVALYLRDALPLLAPNTDPGCVEYLSQYDEYSTHHGVLGALNAGGALFWPRLYTEAGGGDESAVVSALWDLVWRGAVTNDTFAPVRAMVGASAGRPVRRRPTRSPGRGPGRGPGVGLVRQGPPSVGGRWSLTALLHEPAVGPTERALALAAQLLQRHGVLTRGALAVEGVEGGWAAVYQTLKVMEESGRTRRGYFVEGLGGAQFALAGAVDRLRVTTSESTDAIALAATDPANPYGAALAWPDRALAAGHTPRRAAGAHVVLREGLPLVYLEKGARSVLTFTDDVEALSAAAVALGQLVTSGRLRRIRIQRIDGAEPNDQPLLAALREAGFADAPDGLVRR